MKYQIGQKIVIKPIEWYEFNVGPEGSIKRGDIVFHKWMTKYCNQRLAIESINEVNETYAVCMGDQVVWVANWAIDMYTTDKLLYAELHKLGTPNIDRDKAIAINKYMDSSDLFSKDEIIDPEVKIEGEVTLASDAEKFDLSGGLIGSAIRVIPDSEAIPLITESKPKPKRGRKPGSKNKPKGTEPLKAPEGTTKLMKGSKVVAWNESRRNFVVGRYEGSSSSGYSVRTDKNTVVNFKTIHLYSESFILNLINKTFDDTDVTLARYNEFIDKLQSMITEFESEYGVKINRTFDLITE